MPCSKWDLAMTFRRRPINTEAQFQCHARPFLVGVTRVSDFPRSASLFPCQQKRTHSTYPFTHVTDAVWFQKITTLLNSSLPATCSPNRILVSVLRQTKTAHFVTSCVFKVNFCYTFLISPQLPTCHIPLTLRLLMSYIYGAPILDVSRSHTTTHHSR